MPSGSSSRDVSTSSLTTLVLALAAVLAAASPAFAQSHLELTRADLASAASSVSDAPADPPANQPVTLNDPRSRRNPRKALMLSLLLPGLGESYSGHKGRATGFFISEGAIWANF